MQFPVGRNPSQQIGRNPSPRMVLGYQFQRLSHATAELDPNNILVSKVDHGDGSFTITVDDSTAVLDPADGYTILWRALTPSGAIMTDPIHGAEAAFTVLTPPSATSNLVVYCGYTEGNALTAGYMAGGIHYTAANPQIRFFTSNVGNPVDRSPIAGMTSVVMPSVWRTWTTLPRQTRLATVYVNAQNAAGERLDFVTPSVSDSIDASADVHFFIHVSRSATGGGNASITFRPGFIGNVNATQTP